MPSPTREIPLGVPAAFWWVAPVGEVTVSSDVQIRPPTGSGTLTFSITRRGSSETFTVGSDRRTLTAAGITASDFDGLSGPVYGLASLSMDNGDVLEARIQRVTGTTVYLADEVPHDAGDSGTLTSRVWRGALPASVYATVQRGWSWLVIYSIDGGGGLGGAENKTERGELSAVARPFATGVSHEDVAQYLPPLVAARPGREMSLEAAVLGSFEELHRKVGRWAARQSYYVDQLDGAAFADVHAKMAARRMLLAAAGQTGRPETLEVANAIAEDIRVDMDDILNGWVFVDADEDGAVDPGDIATRGGSAIRGTFTDAHNTTLTDAGMVRSTLGRVR